MSRILVLYGTSEGQTAKVVRALAARLYADGVDAEIVCAGTADPRPGDYDGVIVAGSVHAGGYQKSVARWLRAHAGELAAKPTAFISVCLSILSKQQTARDEASAMPKYNFLTRWIMKRIVSAAGGDTDTSRDYEYTDWRDLRDFADRFATLVTPSRAMSA